MSAGTFKELALRNISKSVDECKRIFPSERGFFQRPVLLPVYRRKTFSRKIRNSGSGDLTMTCVLKYPTGILCCSPEWPAGSGKLAGVLTYNAALYERFPISISDEESLIKRTQISMDLDV